MPATLGQGGGGNTKRAAELTPHQREEGGAELTPDSTEEKKGGEGEPP